MAARASFLQSFRLFASSSLSFFSPLRFITADEPLTLFSREDIRRDHIFRHDPVFSLAFSVSREYPRVHATCTIKDACIMTRERERERENEWREHCVGGARGGGGKKFIFTTATATSCFFMTVSSSCSFGGRVTEKKRERGGEREREREKGGREGEQKVGIKTRSIRERRHAREFYARM